MANHRAEPVVVDSDLSKTVHLFKGKMVGEDSMLIDSYITLCCGLHSFDARIARSLGTVIPGTETCKGGDQP